MKRLLLGLLVALCGPTWAAPQHFRKVTIVVLENTDYDDAIQQPFMRSLMHQGALLTDYHAVSHPSLPNYLALVAGTTFGIFDDAEHNLNARHVGDLLEAHHHTWKVYAEGYPGANFLGMTHGLYARRHEPFANFVNMQTPQRSRAHIVPAEQLQSDLEHGQVPDYSFYVPDVNDDGHDTTIVTADQWLQHAFGRRLHDKRFMDGMLFVVTFDESRQYVGDNHIATILVGDMVKPGVRAPARYDHYSLLRTVEDDFGLGTLGQSDATARPIDGIWRR